MVNRPKRIGTAAETAVVRYLQPHGFPHAERRSLRGALDAGDITGTPSVCWEVKGGDAARTASDLDITRWMAELATEVINAEAAVGVLVVQRAGVGPANAGRWWSIMPAFQLADLAAEPCPAVRHIFPVRMLLADAVTLLRHAGYGEPMATMPAANRRALDAVEWPELPVSAGREVPCYDCGRREADHVDGRCGQYRASAYDPAPSVATFDERLSGGRVQTVDVIGGAA